MLSATVLVVEQPVTGSEVVLNEHDEFAGSPEHVNAIEPIYVLAILKL